MSMSSSNRSLRWDGLGPTEWLGNRLRNWNDYVSSMKKKTKEGEGREDDGGDVSSSLMLSKCSPLEIALIFGHDFETIRTIIVNDKNRGGSGGSGGVGELLRMEIIEFILEYGCGGAGGGSSSSSPGVLSYLIQQLPQCFLKANAKNEEDGIKSNLLGLAFGVSARRRKGTYVGPTEHDLKLLMDLLPAENLLKRTIRHQNEDIIDGNSVQKPPLLLCPLEVCLSPDLSSNSNFSDDLKEFIVNKIPYQFHNNNENDLEFIVQQQQQEGDDNDNNKDEETIIKILQTKLNRLQSFKSFRPNWEDKEKFLQLLRILFLNNSFQEAPSPTSTSAGIMSGGISSITTLHLRLPKIELPKVYDKIEDLLLLPQPSPTQVMPQMPSLPMSLITRLSIDLSQLSSSSPSPSSECEDDDETTNKKVITNAFLTCLNMILPTSLPCLQRLAIDVGIGLKLATPTLCQLIEKGVLQQLTIYCRPVIGSKVCTNTDKFTTTTKVPEQQQQQKAQEQQNLLMDDTTTTETAITTTTTGPPPPPLAAVATAETATAAGTGTTSGNPTPATETAAEPAATAPATAAGTGTTNPPPPQQPPPQAIEEAKEDDETTMYLYPKDPVSTTILPILQKLSSSSSSLTKLLIYGGIPPLDQNNNNTELSQVTTALVNVLQQNTTLKVVEFYKLEDYIDINYWRTNIATNNSSKTRNGRRSNRAVEGLLGTFMEEEDQQQDTFDWYRSSSSSTCSKTPSTPPTEGGNSRPLVRPTSRSQPKDTKVAEVDTQQQRQDQQNEHDDSIVTLTATEQDKINKIRYYLLLNRFGRKRVQDPHITKTEIGKLLISHANHDIKQKPQQKQKQQQQQGLEQEGEGKHEEAKQDEDAESKSSIGFPSSNFVSSMYFDLLRCTVNKWASSPSSLPLETVMTDKNTTSKPTTTVASAVAAGSPPEVNNKKRPPPPPPPAEGDQPDVDNKKKKPRQEQAQQQGQQPQAQNQRQRRTSHIDMMPVPPPDTEDTTGMSHLRYQQNVLQQQLWQTQTQLQQNVLQLRTELQLWQIQMRQDQMRQDKLMMQQQQNALRSRQQQQQQQQNATRNRRNSGNRNSNAGNNKRSRRSSSRSVSFGDGGGTNTNSYNTRRQSSSQPPDDNNNNESAEASGIAQPAPPAALQQQQEEEDSDDAAAAAAAAAAASAIRIRCAGTECYRGPPDDDISSSVVGGWPPGWIKRTVERSGGAYSKGRKDNYWDSPGGYTLRSLPEVRRFLQALETTANGDEEKAYETIKVSRR